MFNQKSLGVDLGGTKIAIAEVCCLPEAQRPQTQNLRVIPTFETPSGPLKTPDALREWLDRLANAISLFPTEVTGSIGIASPGKFVDGKVACGTTPQLGSIFESINLRDELIKRLPHSRICIANDALAQLIYAICYELPRSRRSELIAYLGPGTGLGGGFVYHHPNGQIEFLGDGHIGDLVIEGLGEAEPDLFSGMAIQKRFGMSAQQINENIDQHRQKAEQLGSFLFSLMRALKTGNYTKARSSTQWSAELKNSLKSITKVVLGGSIGTKGQLAKIIQNTASEALAKEGFCDIGFHQLTRDCTEAAVIGAAEFPRYKKAIEKPLYL